MKKKPLLTCASPQGVSKMVLLVGNDHEWENLRIPHMPAFILMYCPI